MTAAPTEPARSPARPVRPCCAVSPVNHPAVRRRVRLPREHARSLEWDAMVMIDVDSIVEFGFFDAGERKLATGAVALQARQRGSDRSSVDRPGGARGCSRDRAC